MKKKWLPAALCVGVLVLALTAVLLFLPQETPIEATQYCMLDHDLDIGGNGYIPLPDGTVIDLQETQPLRTAITADRQHILVWQTDGSIYVTDTQLKEKHRVAGPESLCYVNAMNNAGFFYADAQGLYYRFTFADRRSVQLGREIECPRFASNSGTLLYGKAQAVYALPAGASTPRKLGTYTKDFYALAVSDNGKLAVWVEADGPTQTLFMYDGKKQTQLQQIQNEEASYPYSLDITFSRDQKTIVVRSPSDKRLWLKQGNADPISVTFEGRLYTAFSPVYTDAGLLSDVDSQEVALLYIPVKVYAGIHLYSVDMVGSSKRMLNDAYGHTLCFAGRQLFYCSKNDVLYQATVDGSSLQQTRQIAEDVSMVWASQNGQYVYYMQDVEQEHLLYCYQAASGQTHTVAEGVAYGLSNGAETVILSPDGTTVLFFRDVYLAGSIFVGTLMQWNGQEVTTIAENVVTDSLTSGLKKQFLQPDSLLYLQFDATASRDAAIGRRMYFNGKHHRCLVDNVQLEYNYSVPDWLQS